jgi:hypothetical protein
MSHVGFESNKSTVELLVVSVRTFSAMVTGTVPSVSPNPLKTVQSVRAGVPVTYRQVPCARLSKLGAPRMIVRSDEGGPTKYALTLLSAGSSVTFVGPFAIWQVSALRPVGVRFVPV